MKLVRFFVIAIATAVLLAVVTGCASPKEVTNARIRVVAGTNEVLSIDQPKDTTISRAEYRRPDGSVIVIEGYQSTANAAAVAAVESMNKMQGQVMLRALELAKEAGMSGATGGAVRSPNAIPDGWKLVPTDDPSTPKPEIPAN